MKFDPAHTHVVVVAKNNLVSMELMFWLLDGIKIHGSKILSVHHESRDFATIWNTAISKSLRTPATDSEILFCEGDIKPSVLQTQPFLDLETDISCCEYEGEYGHDSQWRVSTSFHLALWRADRQALAKLRPPYVEWPYTKDYCNHTGCLCQSFRRKALNAGLTISHAGYARHAPRSTRCLAMGTNQKDFI